MASRASQARPANSVGQDLVHYADYTEQMGERGIGSLDRECGSMEMCGLRDCPDADSELFGECICSDCFAIDAEPDCGALDEDYVLDVRGLSEIIHGQ